jgi:outer membrane protein insertion porin family
MAWWTGARSLLWAVLLAAFLAPQSAHAQTVTEIRVLGNAQAEESLVFQSFGVKVGDVYQVDRIRQGIRNLYRQGLFRDVQIDVERADEGLILTVRVDENPALLRIRYDGADKLKKKDFDEVVQLVPGQIVSRKSVAQAEKDILALYHEKGYLLATV